MNLVCLTSYELVNTFTNMSLDTVEFDNYSQINKSCKVIIVDENGLIEQNILRYLIELSCTIYYVCDNTNNDIINYLISNNQFNIYTSIEPLSLTASKVLEITKITKTKSDVSQNVESTGKVFSLTSTVEALASFIGAIDTQNVELITDIFEKHFDSFKNVKTIIEDNLLEVDSYRNQVRNLSTELENKQKEYESLDERYGNLISYGKQCEDDNQRLSQELISCKNTVMETENKLSNANAQLDELLLNVQNKDSELQDSRELIDSLKLNLANAQSKNKQLVKANDVLKESLNSIKSVPEDPEVSITSMGSVGKIMYVKMIDPLPYWISAFKYYQKYNSGMNKKSTGLVIVTSKDSIIGSSYLKDDSSNLINSNTEYIDCDKSIYILEGYSADIKKYIENCNCSCVVVLDYTFSSNVFLKSINQIDLFGVNSKSTYTSVGVAPKMCISQARVENVPCRLPFVENYDSLNPIERINIYKENVFPYLDKFWW